MKYFAAIFQHKMSHLHKTATALVKRASFSAAATAMPNAVTLPEALTQEPPRINAPKAQASVTTKAVYPREERYVKRIEKINNYSLLYLLFLYMAALRIRMYAPIRPYRVPGVCRCWVIHGVLRR